MYCILILIMHKINHSLCTIHILFPYYGKNMNLNQANTLPLTRADIDYLTASVEAYQVSSFLNNDLNK